MHKVLYTFLLAGLSLGSQLGKFHTSSHCTWPKSRLLKFEAPLYHSNSWESVSKTYVHQGRICTDTNVAGGIMVSYWLCYGTSFIGGQACDKNASASFGGSATWSPYTDVPTGGCTGQTQLAWRLPLALQTVPAIILLFGAPFLPFSPRWLMSKGRKQECRAVISRLRALPLDDPIVETEYLEIMASVIFDDRTAAELHPGKRGVSLKLAKVGMLFTNKGLFHRLSIGCIIMFFQQFSGINAII